MFGFAESIKYVIEMIQNTKNQEEKYLIMKYAIIGEAKTNNDIATIICRAGIKKTIQNFPKIFSYFSTNTSDILLASGTPAFKVFNEQKTPQETTIESMGKKNLDWIEKKSNAELYEFCIRKCNMVKVLSLTDSLSIPKVNITRRCSNILIATRSLVLRLNK